MRARTELAIALGASAALIVIAFAAGRGARAGDDPDTRASSFVAGREGVRALADAAERLGVPVERFRERPQRYAERRQQARSPRPETFVVLAPSRAVSAAERSAIVRLLNQRGGANLVLANDPNRRTVSCFGFERKGSVFDSSRVAPPGVAADSTSAWTHAHFVPASDTARMDDGIDDEPCPVVTLQRVDTLLATPRGEPVVLRLTTAPTGRTALLVADVSLLRNRTLRTSSTAPYLLDAVLPRGGRLVFDEFHQGFDKGGSMLGVALAWSARHPLGWMAWQLIAVGLLALLVSGVRFGPVRAAIARQRRSPLEHVRALATALAAARGHREAVGAMVRGLRRRLSANTGAAASRDDWRPWLASLVARAPNAKARASAERLQQLSNDSKPETAVLSAANAVEDLWHSLRP